MAFVDSMVDLGGVEVVFRLVGVVDLLGVLGLRTVGEAGLLNMGGRRKLPRSFSTSGGMGMRWAVLTAVHSTSSIMGYSLGVGARQHPGHPRLLL